MRKFLFFIFAFGLIPDICSASDLHSQILNKINNVRRSHGLSVLKENAKLNVAAQSQSDWMSQSRNCTHLREAPRTAEEYKTGNHHPINRVINSGYFTFDQLFKTEYNPDGSGVAFHPLDIAHSNVGEIVASGLGAPNVYDTNIIVRGWMNSPGHRKTILTPHYEEFGVGVTSIRHNETWWCVIFTKR
jgi:uncharacterized protein YkwD